MEGSHLKILLAVTNNHLFNGEFNAPVILVFIIVVHMSSGTRSCLQL